MHILPLIMLHILFLLSCSIFYHLPCCIFYSYPDAYSTSYNVAYSFPLTLLHILPLTLLHTQSLTLLVGWCSTKSFFPRLFHPSHLQEYCNNHSDYTHDTAVTWLHRCSIIQLTLYKVLVAYKLVGVTSPPLPHPPR
jgi:hypothetical protein